MAYKKYQIVSAQPGHCAYDHLPHRPDGTGLISLPVLAWKVLIEESGDRSWTTCDPVCMMDIRPGPFGHAIKYPSGEIRTEFLSFKNVDDYRTSLQFEASYQLTGDKSHE